MGAGRDSEKIEVIALLETHVAGDHDSGVVDGQVRLVVVGDGGKDLTHNEQRNGDCGFYRNNYTATMIISVSPIYKLTVKLPWWSSIPMVKFPGRD